MSGPGRYRLSAKAREQWMNELETRLARIIANTLAQLDGVPTEVEIEVGYAYVKRKGASHGCTDRAVASSSRTTSSVES